MKNRRKYIWAIERTAEKPPFFLTGFLTCFANRFDL